jgi:hypothetical protein
MVDLLGNYLCEEPDNVINIYTTATTALPPRGIESVSEVEFDPQPLD